MRRITVPIVTAADGTATVFSPRLSGKVHSIRYQKIDFTDGVDFAVTAEATGENIWTELNVNASATRVPRQATHGTDGSAALYATGGTAVQTLVALGNDRIKVVITQGGNAKTGTLHFLID